MVVGVNGSGGCWNKIDKVGGKMDHVVVGIKWIRWLFGVKGIRWLLGCKGLVGCHSKMDQVAVTVK